MFSPRISRTLLRLGPLALLLSPSLFTSLTVAAFADSQVRIVRLSEVDGNVQFDDSASQRYQKAFLNLPITQGVKLRAQSDGRAEVEFEDGSTLRVVPDTVVEFPQLSLLGSGAKLSTIRLQQGTAYVNFSGSKDEQLTILFGQEKLVLSRTARLRLNLSASDGTIAVFKGEAQIEGPSGMVHVAKKQTAIFDMDGQDRPRIAKNTEEDPYDGWDKQQDQYHQLYAAGNYHAYSPYSYGTADLSYYGSFFNAPGYGTMWQPYLTGAGWDPFMNGAWAFGPGIGYGWVSAYPWGWIPYHYGSWAFVPGYGWGWQPGSTWLGFNAVPRVLNAPANFVLPQAPLAARGTVVVNRAPALGSQERSANKLLVRSNSAGMGIPRGSIRDLAGVAQRVSQRGSVVAKIQPLAVEPAHAGPTAPARQISAPPPGIGSYGAPSAAAPAARSTGGVRR